ncbi:MAG: long-chain fatty acid--CoA ligase [Bauldia sp.]|nr:long-chain fatty acid--CoA ligase [Bauldia sp.]
MTPGAGATPLLDLWSGFRGAVDCASSGRTWPADDLRGAADIVGRRFARAGVRPGDPVLLMVANTAAFPVALAALLSLGANPFLTFAGAAEATVRRLVGEFGIRHVVHDFAAGVSRLPASTFAVAAETPVGALRLALLATGATETALRPEGRGVILHPTSGTYGAAKYCIRDQAVAIAEARNYVGAIGVYDRCRVTVTTPLTHAFAYGFGLVSTLLTDGTLALDAAFNPKRVLREDALRSTILALVPPMVRRLADLSRGSGQPPMSPHVFYAGAPVDAGVAAAFETVFGRDLHAILGTTETGAIATSYDPAGRLAGVGRPLPDVAVTIAERAATSGLGPGLGELCVRSPSLMQGYLGAPALARDEAFSTGDIARVDDEGCLHLVGRVRDVINLGGMKVDPAEVEAALLAYPGITDAAVYPGLRVEGEFVQAAVVGDDVDVTDLRRHCLAELDAHKVPAIVHVLSALPRTPSGKCLKVQCPGYPEVLLRPGA